MINFITLMDSEVVHNNLAKKRNKQIIGHLTLDKIEWAKNYWVRKVQANVEADLGSWLKIKTSRSWNAGEESLVTNQFTWNKEHLQRSL